MEGWRHQVSGYSQKGSLGANLLINFLGRNKKKTNKKNWRRVNRILIKNDLY